MSYRDPTVRRYISDNVAIPIPSDLECRDCGGTATIYCSDSLMPVICCPRCGIKRFPDLFEHIERPPLSPRRRLREEHPITDDDIPEFISWLKRYFDPLISTADAAHVLRNIFCYVNYAGRLRFACRLYICEGLVTGHLIFKGRSLFYFGGGKKIGGILPRDSVFKSDLAIFISPLDTLKCYVSNARLKGNLDIPIYSFAGWSFRKRRSSPRTSVETDNNFPISFLNINRKADIIIAIPEGCGHREINKTICVADAVGAYISTYDPAEIDDVDALISAIEKRAVRAHDVSFVVYNKPFKLQKDKLVVEKINEHDGVILLGSGAYIIMRKNCWLDALNMTPITNFAAKIVDVRRDKLVVEITYIDGRKIITTVSMHGATVMSGAVRSAIVKAIVRESLVPIILCSSRLLFQLTVLASDTKEMSKKLFQSWR